MSKYSDFVCDVCGESFYSFPTRSCLTLKFKKVSYMGSDFTWHICNKCAQKALKFLTYEIDKNKNILPNTGTNVVSVND